MCLLNSEPLSVLKGNSGESIRVRSPQSTALRVVVVWCLSSVHLLLNFYQQVWTDCGQQRFTALSHFVLVLLIVTRLRSQAKCEGHSRHLFHSIARDVSVLSGRVGGQHGSRGVIRARLHEAST